MPSRRRYKVIFHNQGKIYEIFAKSVSQGELFGFVVVEGIVFGERSQVVVDPGEESLKNEFGGVRRCMIPLHAIIRIDEVDKEGSSRMTAAKGDAGVAPFPSSIYNKPPEKKS